MVLTGNFLTLLTDILSNRKQRVVLYGQHSLWADIKVGVPKVHGRTITLSHVHLTENLHSNPNLFADDTPLFWIVTEGALSNSHLNDNLSKINDWTYKWKMTYSHDSTKLTHQVVFSRKKITFTTLRLHLTTFLISVFNLTNI